LKFPGCKFIRQKRGRESGNTYLAIRHFLEALEDLLGGILIFGDADHEAYKLLKGNSGVPRHPVRAACFHKNLMHFILIVNQAQASQRGRELNLLEGVGVVPIKMSKHRLELLKLYRSKVRHIPGHHLVFQKR
jgi:hypothetical protein